MTTTPNLGIQLLDGAAPNDWRDINQALEDVDGAAATPASVATEVATAISAHEGAPDPHPAYLTAGEADALFLTPAEGDAAYAALAHTHPSEQSGQWRFQDTAGGTPGAGYLRTNTGALATATTLLISRTTQDGYDIPPPGWGVQADDTIYIQDRDDSTKWVRYTALEPLVRFPTYATGLVAVESSAGGAIVNGQIVQVTFSLAGGGGGGGGGSVATDTVWDAKGDLAVGTGADTGARLAAGTDGQVLTADSAQTLGVKWATPAGGGGGMTDPTTTKGDLIARAGSGFYHLVPLATTPSGVQTGDSNQHEFGYEFSCATARLVTGLGWYRASTGAPKAQGLRLWDTTTSSTVINVTSAGSITDSGAVGWQISDVSGLAVTLVAGRRYRAAYGLPMFADYTNASGFTVAPEGDVTAYGQYYALLQGNYPATSIANYFGCTVRLAGAAAETTRLPVGTDGQALVADSTQTLGVKWGGAGALAGTNTTSATGGSATALPSQPQGYLTVVINGTSRKIPYYAT